MADIECPRCGGQGVITEYLHVKEGVCFLCWGDGILYDDNSPKLAAIKAIQARMEIQRRLAAAPHRWQGLLLTCLIDGEEAHFVVSTDNINVPDDVMIISPETPLAKALDRLELLASTTYDGPTGQQIKLTLVHASPISPQGH